jgi:hypothetical protein
MSRLYFAPLEEAFYLKSNTIKDTQTEIDNLKKLITDSQISKKPRQLEYSKEEDNPAKPKKQESGQRIGYSDNVTASFNNKDNLPDTDIFRLIQHPKFDDIVKNYLVVKRPEWINKSLDTTNYIPNNLNQKEQFGGSQRSLQFGGGQRSSQFGGGQRSSQFGGGQRSSQFGGGQRSSQFGGGQRSHFGANNEANYNNCLIFFIISLIVYMLLEKIFKET